jgi:hypothetical protein
MSHGQGLAVEVCGEQPEVSPSRANFHPETSREPEYLCYRNPD